MSQAAMPDEFQFPGLGEMFLTEGQNLQRLMVEETVVTGLLNATGGPPRSPRATAQMCEDQARIRKHIGKTRA